ncbi:hypothetical protein ACWEPH_20440 [Nocardia beijingensis]|uniref:hypothetical protein n=1 Tax=Nocardia beijingensis TaxID=95162 RepID=UPI00082D14C2|nr:hypothetical protein [Nocardia beijingensis]
MTAMRNRPTRIAGAEWGTAVLALFTCLVLSVGITVLTGSAGTAAAATVLLGAAISATSKILPSQ